MKFLVKIIVVLLLLVVVLVGLGVYFLDAGVKKAIETFGPQFVGTEVRLDGVSLAPWSGKGSLSGLAVANPKGFSAANALSLGKIAMQLDLPTLGEDTIVIDALEIVAPQVTFEQNKGKSNLEKLLGNVQRVGGDSAPAEDAAAEGGAGKKLIIRELRFSGGKISYRNPLLGDQSLELDLPDIHLSGIGEKSNGATGAEVAEQILAAVNASSLSAIKDAGVLKDLGKQVEQRLGDERKKVESEIEGQLERFKGLLGK